MAAPMRRLATFCSLAAALALMALPAHAQSPTPSPLPSALELRLLEQTPWTTPEEPTLGMRFRATNRSGSAIEDLTIGVTLFGRVLSRSAYEQALAADPIPAVVIEAETLAREGAIAPGQSRVFELQLLIDDPGISSTQSSIYPLKVDVRSAGIPLAALRTPAIHLVRQPEQPIAIAWTFTLHEPISFRPDGVFVSPALEQELDTGGRLRGQARALTALATAAVPVDIAVSPALLTQLVRMRDGYTTLDGSERREVAEGEGGAAAAAAMLSDLRRAVTSSGVSLSALPFSAPEVPSLVSGGLARDLDEQLIRGREVVGTLLGAPPDPSLFRPPHGALDDASLDALAERGVLTLLADPGTVEAPLQPLGFAPPPVTSLGRDGGMIAVIPDPAIAALIASPTVAADPVLGAQVVLGELASIWQEQPGQARGLALSFPDGQDLPGGFYAAFSERVAEAPWLRPVSALELTERFPPGDPVPLAAPSSTSFSTTYVSEIKQTRRRIDVYRAMLVEESVEPDRLETQLLLAEAGNFLRDPVPGFAFVTSARDTVAAAFGSVTADAGEVITLTSRSGSNIPVQVTNTDELAYRVNVGLVSQYLTESPSQEVVLGPGDTQTLTFPVDLKTTGRFPVLIQVAAPGGRVVNESSVVVRSTEYSRIALIITIAAAAVLVLLWARRFLSRRTT
jgi:hypothetical protein